MTAQTINEKRMKLVEDEEEMNNQLRQHYEALGMLVSRSINYASNDEGIDFSNLQKEPDNHRFKELLQNIDQASFGIEAIKKEITELDSLKTCPKCGTVVDDDELFCSNCGERLVKKTAHAEDGNCPQCGKPKKGEAAFCVYCGYKFDMLEQITKPRGRICVQCGVGLPDDVIFCHICGCKQPDIH